MVGPQKPLILTLWSNKSLLRSWSRALEYLMGSRIQHSGFYFLQHFSRVGLADSGKGLPDLSTWSLPLFGETTEHGERISLISVGGFPPCLEKKLNMETWSPDLKIWRPPLAWRKNWKWRKDFLDLSSGSPPLFGGWKGPMHTNQDNGLTITRLLKNLFLIPSHRIITKSRASFKTEVFFGKSYQFEEMACEENDDE